MLVARLVDMKPVQNIHNKNDDGKWSNIPLLNNIVEELLDWGERNIVLNGGIMVSLWRHTQRNKNSNDNDDSYHYFKT